MTEQQRLGPPPVEGLSDVAWARVERNVFSRMDGTITNAVAAREVKPTTRSNLIWLAVPAAAAAAFALAFFSMNDSPAPPAEEPSRFVAGAAPSTVTFGDAHVTLDANTAVVMDKSARPTALLEHGSALFAVAARGDRAPFTVLAGDASVRTMGAKLRVTRTGEVAKVVVETGSADIRFRGHDVTVTASHTWSSERPAEVDALGTIEIELANP